MGPSSKVVRPRHFDLFLRQEIHVSANDSFGIRDVKMINILLSVVWHSCLGYLMHRGFNEWQKRPVRLLVRHLLRGRPRQVEAEKNWVQDFPICSFDTFPLRHIFSLSGDLTASIQRKRDETKSEHKTKSSRSGQSGVEVERKNRSRVKYNTFLSVRSSQTSLFWVRLCCVDA